MISSLLSRVISLGLGILYPAYASYKAVRTKNVKEYVKWMMYWIVFALFTSIETFTDLFLSWWFPLYYEIKIVLLIWLLSPATHGSSILYRKFVHPALVRREQKIDAMLENAQTQSYNTALELGQRGVRYVTSLVMEGAVRAPGLMADIVQTGQLGLDQRTNTYSQSQSSHQNDTFQLGPDMRIPDMEMSDDDNTVPAAPGQIVEVQEEEEVDSVMEHQGGARRRKKRAAAVTKADISYSSAGEEEEDEDYQPSVSVRKVRAASTKAVGPVSTATTTRKSTRKTKQ